MPTLPLRSARPRPSIRPASDTIPAPRTTPRIPNTGVCDKSAGREAASAAAPPCRAGGAIAVVVAVIGARLLSGSDGHDRGEAWSQPGFLSHVIKRDLHRHPLCHLREIAGGVVWRQESELRSAGWSDLENLSAEDFAWVDIDTNL